MMVQLLSTSNRHVAVNTLVKHIFHGHSTLAVLDPDNAALRERLEGVHPHREACGGEQPHGLIVATSGSTSRHPHLVYLSSEALLASAEATNRALSGPGQWITTLPLNHIAGIQTVVRAAVSGYTPILAPSGRFNAKDFARVVAQARARTPSSVPLYTSLVSPQLLACLNEAPQALSYLDYVLVGGGFIDPSLVERAEQIQSRVVRTYGMTETSGGCVYDGIPLDCATVRIDSDGIVLIAGPMLMSGYFDEPAPLLDEDGQVWFKTSDLGEMAEDGTLRITGRVDDVIKSGGVKVNLRDVEGAASSLGVGRVCALALPDPMWGQQVTLLVERDDVSSLPQRETCAQQLREAVRANLGNAAAPKTVAFTRKMPLTSLGKVDRTLARQQISDLIRQGDVWRR